MGTNWDRANIAEITEVRVGQQSTLDLMNDLNVETTGTSRNCGMDDEGPANSLNSVVDLPARRISLAGNAVRAHRYTPNERHHEQGVPSTVGVHVGRQFSSTVASARPPAHHRPCRILQRSPRHRAAAGRPDGRQGRIGNRTVAEKAVNRTTSRMLRCGTGR